MHASLPTPTMAIGGGDAVAAYRNARGAALAVAALTDRGFPSDAITVRPSALEPVPATCQPRMDRLRTSVIAAVLGGTITAVASYVLIASAILGSFVAVLGGVVAACVASGLGSALARRRNRRLDAAARLVEAGRFEVVVTERAEEANHVLARWWEPEAVPVRLTPVA